MIELLTLAAASVSCVFAATSAFLVYRFRKGTMKQLDDLIANETAESAVLATVAQATKDLLVADAKLRTDLLAALAAAAAAGSVVPQDVQDGINTALNTSQANVDAVKAILADLSPPNPAGAASGAAASDTPSSGAAGGQDTSGVS